MTRYELAAGSVVTIHARSSVHPIHGETRAVRGWAEGTIAGGRISLDPAPAGALEVPVDALRSGNRLQDAELRRRIEARRFPTIGYTLGRVEGGPDRFRLTGTLTFHGVAREVVEEVTASVEGETVVVEGEHTFDITDFGVRLPKILALQVSSDVRVAAHLVFAPLQR